MNPMNPERSCLRGLWGVIPRPTSSCYQVLAHVRRAFALPGSGRGGLMEADEAGHSLDF